MAPTTFALTLFILVGLSTNYVYAGSLEWPEKCKDKYYCTTKPNNTYPSDASIDHILFGKDMTAFTNHGLKERIGDTILEDVASCRSVQNLDPIYAIKDENGTVWYVPQTHNISVIVETYECNNPGRNMKSIIGLKDNVNEGEIRCHEQRVPFKLPVLSQDLKRLEERAISPNRGLPFSCSAKIYKTNSNVPRT